MKEKSLKLMSLNRYLIWHRKTAALLQFFLLKRGGVAVEMNLQVGLSSTVETIVMKKDTASEYGSGSVDVFATPALIALMENASMSAVGLHLEKGYTTVGTRIDIKHVGATPVGMKVTAKAELIEMDGRRLVFKVEAYDEKELIGEGTHERFIVNSEKFIDKVNKKGK